MAVSAVRREIFIVARDQFADEVSIGAVATGLTLTRLILVISGDPVATALGTDCLAAKIFCSWGAKQ
ncbi:MAG TPA: hypothetical protein DC054_07805 [Blastocatellia bacterium]|nr:hypothetical protein [Blastocatellia bacterium]